MLKNDRILSLDVFRGLTIVLMILVNTQGALSYPTLEHAQWNGCTLADLVFPFFLFIVGLTTVISLKKQSAMEKKSVLYRAILRRSFILIFLGLLLNLFPRMNLETLRVYGVLQRIGICYLICSFIYLNASVRMQLFIFLGILLGYWGVMTFIPVPGYGINLTVDGNWVAYFDQKLFSSAHLLDRVYDPEGFFSTFPAIATTLCGVLTGHLLLSSLNQMQKFYLMVFSGVFFLLCGWFWHNSFPINKSLWTSSYVLWSGGWALITFAACFLVIDILDYKKWALPLKIFGVNALFIFIFHVLLLKIQAILHIHLKNGGLVNLKNFITEYLFGGYSSQNASLLYGLLFLLLNFMVVWGLYRRKWFIRI